MAGLASCSVCLAVCAGCPRLVYDLIHDPLSWGDISPAAPLATQPRLSCWFNGTGASEGTSLAKPNQKPGLGGPTDLTPPSAVGVSCHWCGDGVDPTMSRVPALHPLEPCTVYWASGSVSGAGDGWNEAGSGLGTEEPSHWNAASAQGIPSCLSAG